MAALCGFRYNREPSRTWTQTMIPRRCGQCQRLVDENESDPEVPSNKPLWAGTWAASATKDSSWPSPDAALVDLGLTVTAEPTTDDTRHGVTGTT